VVFIDRFDYVRDKDLISITVEYLYLLCIPTIINISNSVWIYETITLT